MQAPKRTTLAEAAAEWLAAAQAGIVRTRSGEHYKPSALRAYEQALRTRLLPGLGHLRLSAVTRTAIQDLVDRLMAGGLAPSTIRNAVLPLRAIYRRALLRSEVATNPTLGLLLPAVRGRRERTARPGEARALLEALPESERALWATALYAGLRRGELQALRWRDIDFAHIPDGSIDLCATDPPYADMVMYSELADYFYVWLRLLLRDKYPNSFKAELVDDSREAVHNVDRNRDGDFYAELVGDVFREVARKLKPGGRLAFSFDHAGEHGWRYIENALVRGGFVVERWWPVFAEMESGVHMLGKNNGGHLDIVFVCGKAGEAKKMVKTKPAAELGAKLAKHLTLVPANYRALLKACEVQRATRRHRTCLMTPLPDRSGSPARILTLAAR